MPLTVETLQAKILTGQNAIDSIVTKNGDQWNMNYVALTKDHITYSFNNKPTLNDPQDYSNTTISFLSEAQKNSVREALTYINDLLNIKFIEATNEDADWYFFNGDYISQTNSAYARWNYSYNYSLSNLEFTRMAYDGFILFDDVEFFSSTNTLAKGDFGYELLLHELGHLLGLEHSFDGEIIASPLSFDSTNYTLMSYESSSPWATEFRDHDISALLYLYGRDGLLGSEGLYSSTAVLRGSNYKDDQLVGTNGPDIFLPTSGAVEIYAGNLGIDIVDFSDAATWNDERNDYLNDGRAISTNFKFSAKGSTFIIESQDGSQKFELSEIERIYFKDKTLAIDLSGNAGSVAKILGAFLGQEGISRADLVGIGLSLLDEGMSYEELIQVAVAAVFGEKPAGSSLVNMFYRNLTGESPPESLLYEYSALIDSGQITALNLATQVAEHELNLANIDLIGLASTGLEYI